MTSANLQVRQGISLSHIGGLARAFSEADNIECGAVGLTPYASLIYGRDAGPCWSVFDGMDFDKQPVAAGGFTRQDRSIWAYFGVLTTEQGRDAARKTGGWIRDMVKMAGPGYPLHNCIWEENLASIAWLKATHCFNFLDKAIRVGPHRFLQFEAKPLEEIPIHV